MGKEYIGSALSKACEYDADNKAAAKIVRRDMLQLKNKFDGSFDSKCQEESVPSSLMTTPGKCMIQSLLHFVH